MTAPEKTNGHPFPTHPPEPRERPAPTRHLVVEVRDGKDVIDTEEPSVAEVTAWLIGLGWEVNGSLGKIREPLADDIQFGAAPTVVTTPEQARKKDEYGRAWPAELPPGSRCNIWNERESRDIDTDVSGWKLTWDMAGRQALYQSGPPPEPYVFAEHVVFPDITSAKLAPSRAVAVLPRETTIDEDEDEHEGVVAEAPAGKLPSERANEIALARAAASVSGEDAKWLNYSVGWEDVLQVLDERLGRG